MIWAFPSFVGSGFPLQSFFHARYKPNATKGFSFQSLTQFYKQNKFNKHHSGFQILQLSCSLKPDSYPTPNYVSKLAICYSLLFLTIKIAIIK